MRKQRKRVLLREGASYCCMLASKPLLVLVHFLEAEGKRDKLDRMYDAWEVAKQEDFDLGYNSALGAEVSLQAQACGVGGFQETQVSVRRLCDCGGLGKDMSFML